MEPEPWRHRCSFRPRCFSTASHDLLINRNLSLIKYLRRRKDPKNVNELSKAC
jgi:hypothetical protein